MKSIIIICALSSLRFVSIAQCDKNITYNADKADFVDSLGHSVDTKRGKITVTVTKKDFVLMHDDDESDALRGNIKNFACHWNDAYKNGETTFESQLVKKNGEKSNVTVSIAGKDGNLLIQVNFKSRGMILNIIPLSHSEAKE